MRHPLAAVLCSMLVASGASAAPEITVLSATRQVDTALGVDNGLDYFPSSSSAFNQILGPDNGPWTDFLNSALTGQTGAFAGGFAYQQSNQSTFAIEGEGSLSTQSSSLGPNEEASARANTGVSYSITVPEDSQFSLTGEVTFEVSSPETNAGVSVFVFGTRQGGGFIFESASVNSSEMDPANPFLFFISDIVEAGSELSISIGGGCESTGTSNGSLSFEFELNFGDTDRDGLLDLWETEGIDIDGDGIPEVVLPNADPMKKDLYVEVDAMGDSPLDMGAIADVVAAFAAAPGHLVKNPDGTDGINLHIDYSDTAMPSAELPTMEALDAYKAVWWGSQADREDENAEAIRAARSKAYRYCIWGTTINGPTGISGRGEIAGNDFIVAAGAIGNVLRRQKLAGTFMHELGHNLGLEHGGQDEVNYKPNYLSVMNYNYQFPLSGTESAFQLDYSRQEIMPLFEPSLEEQLGLDGPSGKIVMFNSAPDGSPPVRTLVDADAVEVDWNGNGMFEFNAVEHDINRMRPSHPASMGDFHVCYTDWDKLWYHLTGSSRFDDGAPRPPGSIPEELTQDEWLEFESTGVLDLTGGEACSADLTTTGATIPGFEGYGEPDGVADLDDLGYYLNLWLALDAGADLTTSGATLPPQVGYGIGDGVVDLDDLGFFLNAWLTGCG